MHWLYLALFVNPVTFLSILMNEVEVLELKESPGIPFYRNKSEISIFVLNTEV